MRLRVLPLLLPLALVLGAAPAAAQGPSRQKASVEFTDQRPGTSSGARIEIDYRNPSDPAAKPFAVQRVITTLAAGARIDTGVPAQCKLTDSELTANGARDCPAASIVGSGVTTLSSTDVNPTATLDVTLINNANELIFLAASRESPGSRLVIRSPVRGTTITTEVPRVPGGPPDGVTAIRTASLRIGETSRREGSRTLGYITTPPTCPASGAFANSATFAYFDGITQTVPAPSPCIDMAPPTVALAGFPSRGCVRRDVRARVRVEDASALRGVIVRLNGRKLKGTTSKRFKVRVRKARMRSGRNRLTITAVDRRGNRFVRTHRFSRCR